LAAEGDHDDQQCPSTVYKSVEEESRSQKRQRRSCWHGKGHGKAGTTIKENEEVYHRRGRTAMSASVKFAGEPFTSCSGGYCRKKKSASRCKKKKIVESAQVSRGVPRSRKLHKKRGGAFQGKSDDLRNTEDRRKIVRRGGKGRKTFQLSDGKKGEGG